MELKGKNIVVVGMGTSGSSAGRLLLSKGAKLKMLDRKAEEELGKLPYEFRELGAEVKCGPYKEEDFKGAEVVVLSPGINEQDELFRKLRASGTTIMGELELGFRFINAPIIGITGTNGKSTVTMLVGEIFKKEFGTAVGVGGNLGKPVCELAMENGLRVVVLEVSSFQLDQSISFKPKIGLMLNLTEDHLDRHRTMEDYYRAKLRLFLNQDEGDFCILNSQDEWAKRMACEVKSRVLWFGGKERIGQGVYLSNREVIYEDEKKKFSVPISNWKLIGKHNLENLMAGIACAGAFGIGSSSIDEAIREFKGLPHRLEYVGEIRNVKYYDDSKGTNPASVKVAVECFSGNLILLLGGRNKGYSFKELGVWLENRITGAICFGESATEIKESLGSRSYWVECVEKMSDAVAMAIEKAKPFDVVLLSPGCASFDEFRDYKHRGDVFKELVKNLGGRAWTL